MLLLVIRIILRLCYNLILQLFHFGIPEMTLYPGRPAHPLSQFKQNASNGVRGLAVIIWRPQISTLACSQARPYNPSFNAPPFGDHAVCKLASFPGSPCSQTRRTWEQDKPSVTSHYTRHTCACAQWKIGWGLRMTFDLFANVVVPEVQVQLRVITSYC